MRLSILDSGHRLRARLFFVATGRDAPDIVRTLLYRPEFFARPLLEVTGLALVDRIDGLDRYHLFHAARADLLRQLDRPTEAAAAYRRAHELATNPADRRFLAGRALDIQEPT
jgi:hypothetical protein